MDKHQELEGLYEDFVKDLRNVVKKPDSLTAADRSVIRQFLKDNNITSIPTKNNELGNLLADLLPSDEDLVEDFSMN